jgi:hypothetical protein
MNRLQLTVLTVVQLLPGASTSSSAEMCVMNDEDICVFPCTQKSSVHIQDTSGIEHLEEGKN